LTHLWLQLLEAFIKLDLLLQVCLLPVTLCDLLVLLITRLEALVLKIVSHCLHREDWRANLTVAGNPWDGKHFGQMIDAATLPIV